MPAIKHLEKLKSGAYFKDNDLPYIIREMREAPSNAFVAMHDHEFSELVVVASGRISHIHAGNPDSGRAMAKILGTGTMPGER